MSNISSKLNNKELTVLINGRIDSTNSPQIESEINSLLNITEFTSLIFDVEKLEYISSAGLRVILRIRKDNPSLKIINASPVVYDVFDMTGFVDMMPVEKAFRTIDIDGFELIGKGATGKVYRMDPETIVKCYFKKDALEEIRREREFARKAFILGIPTAISYDIVRVGDGYGAVFELLNADTFLNLIKRDPENIDTYISRAVEILKQFHSTKVAQNTFPNKKEIGIRWAKEASEYLPKEQRDKLLSLFEDLKDNDTLLHGDYHIKNIMMQKDEVLLIDMDTLCTGNAVFEFAGLFNAYIAYSDLNKNNSMEFFGIPYETTEYLFYKTLETYLGTADKAQFDLACKKSALVGYTEMVKTFAEEDKNSAASIHYINQLIKLINELDSISL